MYILCMEVATTLHNCTQFEQYEKGQIIMLTLSKASPSRVNILLSNYTSDNNKNSDKKWGMLQLQLHCSEGIGATRTTKQAT